MIDQDGNLTAKEPGAVTVTATLAQNPAQTADMEIEIGSGTETGVRILTAAPQSLGPLDSVHLRAACFVNGVDSGESVTWSLTGAKPSAYHAAPNGNEIYITCFGYSETPLTVLALCNGYSDSVEIRLEDI